MQGVPLTAQELADMVWTGQADVEECIAEAEQQQKRALSCYVSDILAVLVGLGYVQPRANEVGCALAAIALPTQHWCVRTHAAFTEHFRPKQTASAALFGTSTCGRARS